MQKRGPFKKIKTDLGQIVTAESATLAGYKPIPINADHLTMCKSLHNQTTGYVDVTGMLKLIISNLDKDIDDLKSEGKTTIRLGDVKQGDNVLSYRIIAGHVVGTTKDANKLEVSNTFVSSGGNDAVAAWMANKAAKNTEAKSSRTYEDHDSVRVVYGGEMGVASVNCLSGLEFGAAFVDGLL